MNNHIDPNKLVVSTVVSPSSSSDHELLSRLPELASRERKLTASLVAHLAELDARRLYLGQGCASLFAYCVEILHLSGYEAYARIETARVARRFPVILEMITRGDDHLTAVLLLASFLTEANHLDLLGAAQHKSERGVARLVAELRPKPAVPDSIRKLPEGPVSRASSGGGFSRGGAADAVAPAAPPSAAAPSAAALVAPATGSPVCRPAPASAPGPVAGSTARRGIAEPLGADRFRVQFTASAGVLEKLRVAQDLLRHQIPDGELGSVFDRALTALIEQLSRSKFAAARPQGARRGRSTHVSPGEAKPAGPSVGAVDGPAIGPGIPRAVA